MSDRTLEHLVLQLRAWAAAHAVARERLRGPIHALVERAKAEGRLRRDFEASDIRMIHTMLAAVVHETHGVAPELWRRYFTLIVDGLASARTAPTASGIAAPSSR